MTINNLEIIKPLLEWETPDDFYFVQILRRKKENPDNTSNNTVIRTYYVSSVEVLDKMFPEMALLAKFYNARVYINLNRRSYEKLAFQMLKKVTDCIINKGFKDVKNAYNSVCGAFHNEKNKKWIIDLDGVAEHEERHFIDVISELDGKIYACIPTVGGKHLITSPFNIQEFSNKCAGNLPDIQKNNPTLLFF